MKWMIFGAACLLGTAQHFLYEPLGRPAALRWLLPTSESPWEHFKLAFWPLCAALALWGGLQGAAAGTILCACCLGASHAFCTMMGIYFFYRAALGVKRPVLWTDIGNFYVTMLLGWRLGLRTLGGSFGLLQAALAAAVLLGWWAVFLLPERKAPGWPLFADPAAPKNKRNRE